MLTPDYIRNMTAKIRRLAQEYEDDIIAAIVAALLAWEPGTTIELTEFAQTINEIMESYQYAGVREIRHIIRDAVMESAAAEQQVYIEAEKHLPEEYEPPVQEEPQEEPKTEPTVVPEQPPQVPNPMLDPYSRDLISYTDKATNDEWINLTKTVAYRGNERLVMAMDEAELEIETGAKSHDKAVRDAVHEVSNEGITTATSETSGREEHADTIIERATRTAVAKLAGDIALHNAIENGFTLVLVSAHYGARPTHEVWQGKVYSINGDTSKYPDFWKETQYGEMLGLCGINCRHSFSAFAEGMRNPYEGTDYSDPKRYEDEQKQREMERRIRKLRRLLNTLRQEYDAHPTPELKAQMKNLRAKIKQAVAEYEALCAEHDFRPLWERTRA